MPVRVGSRRRVMPRAAAPQWLRFARFQTGSPIGEIPRELSGFIGRREEIAALVGHLRDNASLITLTGIGGVGKTRLGTQVAAELRTSYPDGARFVTLAHLPETGDVAKAVLAGLGVRERPHTTGTDTLADELRDAQLLLVLDNCEQVVQASAELVDHLLRRCPGVHILATSRESLGVPGELVIRVQPLPFPADDQPFAALEHNAAVELFVARATAVEPRFRLTAASGASVGRICRLVDGIPLAIELAAARTKSMNVAEIAEHLADPLALLTVAPRTAPARQQTMRATIDWSYALLTPPEQILLRRVAVFRGGFTLEAAQVVCTDPDLPPSQVVDLLDRLVSKSLLVALPDRETTRFTQVETLRSYLRLRLATAGEDDDFRARHRDWCLTIAERVPAELLDTDHADALAREQDNLLSALRWTLESDQAAPAARLAVSLASLWLLRGSFGEGRAQLTAVSQLPSAASSPALTSLACSWAALFAHNEGAYTVAEHLAARGLSLAAAANDDHARLVAMSQLVQAALGQGDMPLAAERCTTALRLADGGGPLAAVIAFDFSIAALELGDTERAEQLLAQAASWAHAANFRFGEGRLLAMEAVFVERVGDRKSADRLLSAAVAAERTIGSLPGLIEVLTVAGVILVDRGDRVGAANVLSEALAAAALHGSHVRLARVFEAMSGLLAESHPETSVRTAATAQELRESLRALPLPGESGRLGRHLEHARRRLGEAAYLASWRAARATPLEIIVEEASALLRQLGPTPAAASPRQPPAADSLTAREREVALLVVRGLSNREIAAELVVTRKTAEAHISHILTKLGLSSRVQIATWAYGCGLAQPDATLPPTG